MESDDAIEAALFAAQKAAALRKEVRLSPLDPNLIQKYNDTFAKYTLGDGAIPRDVLEEIHNTVAPFVNGDVRTSAESCRRLLECVGYVKPGDNLFRAQVEAKGGLRQSSNAEKRAKGCANVKDPFDPIRVIVEDPVYAIDSISTSEVDDAIGIDEDGKYVTVYVADATAYCQIDTPLDKGTGGKLATTTYLPEGVFFMLPKELVQAATLAPDRPCRCFHAKFFFNDDGSINLEDYTVGVSLAKCVRRITYNVCQDILNNPASSSPPPSAPTWMTSTDVAKILQLDRLRIRRKEHRIREGAWRLLAPKPSLEVNPATFMIKLKAQEQISLQGAYNLVEEMMVAANEVCTRFAVTSDTIIPFRVTRPLSNRHTINVSTSDTLEDPLSLWPPGVLERSSSETSIPSNEVSALSRTIADDTLALRSVTRAYYSHQQGTHSFLNTIYYCHATSPLRRYADMLVHHQLKATLALHNNIPPKTSGYEKFQVITMKDKCAKISKLSHDSKMLQAKSLMFWSLKYIKEEVKDKTIQAIVAYNYVSSASPLMSYSKAPYVARIVLGRILLCTTLYHADSTLGPGDVVDLDVLEVCPIRLVLKLKLRARVEGPSATTRRRIGVEEFGQNLFSDI